MVEAPRRRPGRRSPMLWPALSPGRFHCRHSHRDWRWEAAKRTGPVRSPTTMCGMCGIVGYAGHQEAVDVVVAGLNRLEYRGYDSAGVAVGWTPPSSCARRPESWPTCRARLATRRPPVHHGHRAHPLGHPRPPDRPQRPSARRLHGGASPSSTTASSRTSPPSGWSSDERGHRAGLRDRHRGRGAPAGGGRWPTALAWPRRCAGSACGSTGRSPCVAVCSDEPDLVVGARRNSPLVVGRR